MKNLGYSSNTEKFLTPRMGMRESQKRTFGESMDVFEIQMSSNTKDEYFL